MLLEPASRGGKGVFISPDKPHGNGKVLIVFGCIARVGQWVIHIITKPVTKSLCNTFSLKIFCVYGKQFLVNVISYKDK